MTERRAGWAGNNAVILGKTVKSFSFYAAQGLMSAVIKMSYELYHRFSFRNAWFNYSIYVLQN